MNLLLLLAPFASASLDYTADHNVKRCLHCATPIATRSATLEAEAQAYADTCPTGHASYADRNSAGENLYWAGFMASRTPTIAESYEDAVNSWYSEIANYDFTTGSSNGGTVMGGAIGHFTQIVWKDSIQIGCGVKRDCTNRFSSGFTNSAVVCRYLPHGNFNNNHLTQVGHLVTAGTQCTQSDSSCSAPASASSPPPASSGTSSPPPPASSGASSPPPSASGNSSSPATSPTSEAGEAAAGGDSVAGAVLWIVFAVLAVAALGGLWFQRSKVQAWWANRTGETTTTAKQVTTAKPAEVTTTAGEGKV